jgi:hypothetical protein
VLLRLVSFTLDVVMFSVIKPSVTMSCVAAPQHWSPMTKRLTTLTPWMGGVVDGVTGVGQAVVVDQRERREDRFPGNGTATKLKKTFLKRNYC